jgi:hypothetical protein
VIDKLEGVCLNGSVPFGDGKDELYFNIYAYCGNNMSVGKKLTDDGAVVRRRLRTR